MEENAFKNKLKRELEQYNKVNRFETLNIVFWKLTLIGIFLFGLLILILLIVFMLGEAFDEDLAYLPVGWVDYTVIGLILLVLGVIFFIRGKVVKIKNQVETQSVVGYKKSGSEQSFLSMIIMFFDFCSYTFYSLFCLDKIEKKKQVVILPEDINNTARIYEYIETNLPVALADLYHNPSLFDISKEEKDRLLKPLLTMGLVLINENNILERVIKTSGSNLINFR